MAVRVISPGARLVGLCLITAVTLIGTSGCHDRSSEPDPLIQAMPRDDQVLAAVFHHLLLRSPQHGLCFLLISEDRVVNPDPFLLRRLAHGDQRVRPGSDAVWFDHIHDRVSGQPGVILVATIRRWIDEQHAAVLADRITDPLSDHGRSDGIVALIDGEWVYQSSPVR